MINIMKNLEWWWKFSIFGQNSRFLKVLAHEISEEIPKKIMGKLLGLEYPGTDEEAIKVVERDLSTYLPEDGF